MKPEERGREREREREMGEGGREREREGEVSACVCTCLSLCEELHSIFHRGTARSLPSSMIHAGGKNFTTTKSKLCLFTIVTANCNA